MLRLEIQGLDGWDEKKEEFVSTPSATLMLEHSLVSISKWEAKWERSYLSKPPRTREEQIDYVRCMTVTRNVPPEVYSGLTGQHLRIVQQYIDSPGCATRITSPQKPGGKGPSITSEQVYYWMIFFGIPFECQKWHFNRLMTLIRICEIKSRNPKKQNRSEMLKNRAALNAQRKAMYNTRG